MKLLWLLLNYNLSTKPPITGAGADISLKILRGADNYLLDWDDLTFKASGWTTLATTMDEIDAVNYAGAYEKEIDVSSWEDGDYHGIAAYAGSAAPQSESFEFSVETNMFRALGLMQENIYEDQCVYNSDHRLLSARRRIYSDAASVGTTSNVLATYIITATWENNELQTYKAVMI